MQGATPQEVRRAGGGAVRVLSAYCSDGVLTLEIDIGDLQTGPRPAPTHVKDACGKALAAAATALGVTQESLLRRTRADPWCLGRQVAMHCAFERGGVTYNSIGTWFGVHHGTVMHASRRIAERKQLEKRVARLVEAVESALASEP